MSTSPQPDISSSSFAPQASGGKTVLIVIAAILLSALAIGSYVYFNPTPPGAAGQVEQVWAYPVHRVSNLGAGGEGTVGATQSFDEVIVVARIKLRNESKIPLFIHDMWAVADFPLDASTQSSEGQTGGQRSGQNDQNSEESHRALAVSPADFKRVFLAYPETAVHQNEAPLLRDSTVEAGQSAEGLMIFNYPVTKAQWDAKKSLDITISFLHQEDLTLKAP